MRARAIFVGGTASHVGKSWMTTALCRHLRRRGLRVAPFKAQNMSNNSYPCKAGGEIGRAQVAQAEACGLDPEPAMNPVLLKPSANMQSQVIVNGFVSHELSAMPYLQRSEQLRQVAHQAYDQLAHRFEVIVIEGAGSVAEMNLKPRDFINLSMARYAGAKGLLVGDIDRGGIFASLIGTYELLDPEERALLPAFAVNRFRGDRALFQDGIAILEERSRARCLGVFAMRENPGLQEEDAVALEETANSPTAKIAVLRFPRVSNFTDFRHLQVNWLTSPDHRDYEWIILPGTKNTIADLAWLRNAGFEPWLRQQHRKGAKLLGICGGFQMLGQTIVDAHGVENASTAEAIGLGYFAAQTMLQQTKTVRTVKAKVNGIEAGAYEIHMGETHWPNATARPTAFATLADGTRDGAQADGIFGTYLHGLFEDAALASELFGPQAMQPRTADPYDQLADWFEAHADLNLFEELYL